MDTANTGNLLWAIAVIGGPVILALALLYGVMQRRRRRTATEERIAAERFKDPNGG